MISCRAGQLTMRVLLRPAAMISAQSMASLQCKGAAELVGSAVVPELSDRFGTAPATPTQARFSSFFQQTFATLAVLPAKKASGALPCTLQLTSARPIENSYRALGEAARYFAKDAIPQAEAGGLEALKEHANHAPENSKPTAENLDPAGLLKRLNVMRFRESLAAEAESRPTISNGDFLALCRSSGTASSDEEAARICTVLADAGIVLRFADLVYLRPMDIAEYIVQALPGSQAEVQERLDFLRQELQPMEVRKKQIDRTAHRWVSTLLWVGLGSFVFQWVLFLRLTFWELSWDVMEPVCYFVSSAGGIAAYCYFLATHEDFGYAPWRSRIASNLQNGGYARKGLDLRRYQMLQRDLHRLERFLKR